MVLISELETNTANREQLKRIGRKVRRRLAAHPGVRKLDSDKAELWAVPNFFDPVECGQLIAMIDAVAQPSAAYEVDYATAYRTSYSGNLDPFDPVVRKLQSRIDELIGLDGSWGETLQGQRYAQGQEFRAHNDWFSSTSPGWESEKARGGQRSITAMAYLNAVEAGGETGFPRLKLAVKPRPGLLLLWNNADEDGAPNPFTLHAGTPVTRGTKYVVTRWYRCGKWY